MGIRHPKIFLDSKMNSNVLYLGNDDLFFQNLNGIQVVGCFLLTKDYFTKGALPEDFQEFKIIQ